MNKPHKHAELIKAWADGAEIQYKDEDLKWVNCGLRTPTWRDDHEYRIKPEPNPEPVKRTLYIYNNILGSTTWISATRYHTRHEGPHCQYMGSIEVEA